MVEVLLVLYCLLQYVLGSAVISVFIVELIIYGCLVGGRERSERQGGLLGGFAP